ncbi:MAG: Gfo/Idh/MocA family oxidoreductase [Gammaproteobacteria bacterium]|nr:Gfo/Idh/MocA family oxidoreductase [Gammaproteobacteria bacterium]
MARAIRFAVVGLGMGKGRSEVCRQTPGAELAAVCDLSAERGREAERAWGVPWVASYDELLARGDVDVVGLWTPSGSHAGMAVQALRAGKHVCMTKPMDITTAACDAAIHEAESRGLLLAVDFEQRFRPLNQRVKAALDAGAIGDLLFADLRMKWYRAQSYYDSGHPVSWRSRLDTEGGSLANQAVHFLDLLLWWAGDPERVAGRRGTYSHDIQTEDGAAAVIQFKSGAVGSVLTTTCSFPHIGSALTLSGRWGTLTWNDSDGVVDFRHLPEERRSGADAFRAEAGPTAQPGDLNAFPDPPAVPDNIFADVVGALHHGTALQCDGREGRRTVALFEAVYAASDHDAWVEVS